MLIALAALMLAGCPRPPVVIPVDWSQTPHLPAPTAPVYSSLPARPEDRGVATVVGLRTWDAALSGAATGIALQVLNGTGSLTPPELREAALRAGWPYPLIGGQAWPGELNSPPPKGVQDWLVSLPTGATVGLVRARGVEQDLWVGVASTVRVDIGQMPRQLPVGATLKIPAVPGAEVWVADPFGRLDHGQLDIPFTRTADVAGEWLVELRDREGPLASFPVYVGMVPPDLGLLVPSPLPTEWQEADNLVVDLLADIRSAYGFRPYENDLLLQTAAQSAAADPNLDVKMIAPQVGLPPSNVWRWDCQAANVETCLDAILWDVRARPGLLASRALFGRHVSLTTSGVRIVLVVAREAS
jgi:hypothetical protein